MTETVKKLMEGLKATTRTPTPKQVSPQRTKPSTTTLPSTKLPPSEIGQQIAKLSIPEVAPVESIKQRLDQIQVQSLSDTSTSASQQSPGENRYFAIIREAINKHWVNPNVPIKNKKVIITFHVEKTGEISRVHVEQSSGNTYYDSTILGAINKANPLPKFPSDLQKSFLNIKFLFTMAEQ
jgi:TonB family protein